MKRLLCLLALAAMVACAAKRDSTSAITARVATQSDFSVQERTDTWRIDSVVDFWHEIVAIDSLGRVKSKVTERWQGRWNSLKGGYVADKTEQRGDSVTVAVSEEEEQRRRTTDKWPLGIVAIVAGLYVLSLIQTRSR